MDMATHTFSYKHIRCSVNDLIAFLETLDLKSVVIPIPIEELKQTNVSDRWKTITMMNNQITKTETVTFYTIVKHIRRVMQADYNKYPIVMHNGIVLDGFHRLVHALYDEKTTIEAYQLSDNDMEQFLYYYDHKYNKLEQNQSTSQPTASLQKNKMCITLR